MNAFFKSLIAKLVVFLINVHPAGFAKFVVGVTRPALVSQGVDMTEARRIIALVGNSLVSPGTPSPDDALTVEGGVDVVRGIIAYFGAQDMGLTDQAVGTFLVTTAAAL